MTTSWDDPDEVDDGFSLQEIEYKVCEYSDADDYDDVVDSDDGDDSHFLPTIVLLIMILVSWFL